MDILGEFTKQQEYIEGTFGVVLGYTEGIEDFMEDTEDEYSIEDYIGYKKDNHYREQQGRADL
jgi:hypothetical protein